MSKCTPSLLTTEVTLSSLVVTDECGAVLIETPATPFIGEDRFKGYYATFEELVAEIPYGGEGAIAYVSVGGLAGPQIYIWDSITGAWVLPDNTQITAPELKALYESNDNTNAFTDLEKEKLEGLENYDDSAITSSLVGLQDNLEDKVDKVAGKSLSTEDFTTEYKQSLDSLSQGDYVWKESNW